MAATRASKIITGAHLGAGFGIGVGATVGSALDSPLFWLAASIVGLLLGIGAGAAASKPAPSR